MRTSEIQTKNSSSLSNIKVKDIVTENFRAAKIFEKYEIDYCCHGNRLLAEVIKEKNLTAAEIQSQLKQLESSEEKDLNNYSEWDLDRLSQYIVNTHHAYVKEASPRIKEHLEKIFNAHGSKYSYLEELRAAFDSIAREMSSHMMKEEQMLFPLIHYLAETKKFNEKPKTNGYGTIKNPIRKMEEEHSSAGEVLSTMKELTNNYSLPKDACTTFKITYEELKEFESDLHKHIHLENNILFPRAIKLEEELLKL